MTDKEIVEHFYQAFQNLDTERMVSFYDENIEFNDPVFGTLIGNDAKDMWRFLIERSKGDLKVNYSDIHEKNGKCYAYWEAKYHFSKTKRAVHNKVNAEIEIIDGKIVRHTDSFNFYRCSQMAFGPIAYMIGFTSFFKNKINHGILKIFRSYQVKRNTQ
jgi:ketosteroid isomerase-like protein